MIRNNVNLNINEARNTRIKANVKQEINYAY